MANKLIKKYTVGPVVLYVRYYKSNGEYRVKWCENGVYVSKYHYYTDDKDDALATAEKMVEKLEAKYVKLPIECQLPKMNYTVSRPESMTKYTVTLLDYGHKISYSLNVSTHDMTLKLDVRFNGVPWTSIKVTDDNRKEVMIFWRDLGTEEFKHRSIDIEQRRLDADNYFKSIKHQNYEED